MIQLVCLLLCFSGDAWQDGNDAYREGRYPDAITHYHALLDSGTETGALHFNLGNAYLRDGSLGRALLHYYRAERYMPYDDDLQHNIQVANQLRTDPQIDEENDAFLRGVDHIMSWLNPKVPFYLALLTWLIAGVASLGLVVLRDKTRLLGYVLVVAGIIAILGTGMSLIQHRHLSQSEYAVVLAAEVQVMAGPSRKESVSFTIHEGIRCQIMSEADSWLRIRLANGYNGWVPASQIERI